LQQLGAGNARASEAGGRKQENKLSLRGTKRSGVTKQSRESKKDAGY